MAIDDLDLPLSSMFSISWLLSAIFFSCWSSHCGVSCLYLVDSSVLARSLGCDDVHDSWFFSCFYALISMLFTPFFFLILGACNLGSQASQLLDQNELTAYVYEEHLVCK
jgi:hypothetical protein